ncbi:MAG: hypothetical protein M1829_003138 [Trizodia sp. TS-e1964]|nr:MAG: hypothetical protein M1829_003138 [Trizodia sp. TS-e1964]
MHPPRPQSATFSHVHFSEPFPELPHINEQETLIEVIRKLSFPSLPSPLHDDTLTEGPRILRWHFSELEPDDRGIHEARATACEIVAWRLLAHFSELEKIDYLLYELPSPTASETASSIEDGHPNTNARPAQHDESLGLLSNQPSTRDSTSTHADIRNVASQEPETEDQDPTSAFVGMNALEIAAVADAKRFLSQRPVQKIVNGIWNGDIVFWDSLSIHSKKKARIYNERYEQVSHHTWLCDGLMETERPTLIVDFYQKAFEILFFASFLALYYAVLVERNPYKITFIEIILYTWIAAFAYDEISEFRDAGTLFYATDFWSMWDIVIIAIGGAYIIASMLRMKSSRPKLDKLLHGKILFLKRQAGLAPTVADPTNRNYRPCQR